MFDKELFGYYDPSSKNDLLEDWRWLIGSTAQPFLITVLGDAFVQENDGTVFWLQVTAGDYTKVANSFEEFSEEFEKNYEEWILPGLALAVLEEKGVLPPNSCFSMDIPAFLGGEYSIENYNHCDMFTHFSMHGEVYAQAYAMTHTDGNE